MRWIVLLAGLLGAAGVAIGANAAHGLEASLTDQGLPADEIAKRLSNCDVAVRYHMTHTLALLAIGLTTATGNSRRGSSACVFFTLGIALFCGGLYSMVYLGLMGHWAIVPLGGLCFMLGWLCLATLAWGRSHDRNAD